MFLRQKPEVPILQPGEWLQGLRVLVPMTEGNGRPRNLADNTSTGGGAVTWTGGANGGSAIKFVSSAPSVALGFTPSHTNSWTFLVVIDFDRYQETFPNISGIFACGSSFVVRLGDAGVPSSQLQIITGTKNNLCTVPLNTRVPILLSSRAGAVSVWCGGMLVGAWTASPFTTSATANLLTDDTGGRSPFGAMEMFAAWDGALPQFVAQRLSLSPYDMIAPTRPLRIYPQPYVPRRLLGGAQMRSL